MGAPKGNQYWKLRSKHGREKLFATPELLWEAACEYFDWVDENPIIILEQRKQAPKIAVGSEGGLEVDDKCSLPQQRPYTESGLCLYLCCNRAYFWDFKKYIAGKDDEMSKDFADIIARIEQIIYTQKFDGATCGIFNSNIIARDLGLIDKQEVKSDLNIKNFESLSTEELIKRADAIKTIDKAEK